MLKKIGIILLKRKITGQSIRIFKENIPILHEFFVFLVFWGFFIKENEEPFENMHFKIWKLHKYAL